jgi:hypothetical protein
MPNRIHVGARLRVVPPEHIPAIPIEEGRDPVIGNAVHVHRDILPLLHYRAELLEVLLGRVLKINRDVRVGHAETANAARLIQESFLVRVECEIDDVCGRRVRGSRRVASRWVDPTW